MFEMKSDNLAVTPCCLESQLKAAPMVCMVLLFVNDGRSDIWVRDTDKLETNPYVSPGASMMLVTAHSRYQNYSRSSENAGI
jgi:hypothetical protein